MNERIVCVCVFLYNNNRHQKKRSSTNSKCVVYNVHTKSENKNKKREFIKNKGTNPQTNVRGCEIQKNDVLKKILIFFQSKNTSFLVPK